MNKHQIDSLLSLINQLHRQKYSVLVIAVIAVLSLVYSFFPSAANQCEVLKIYDGDTMTLQCQGEQTKVRLYCIDAPEMGQTPWGTQARDYLRSITGRTVKLVRVDKDRYGRIVGEVYNGEVNLNLAQVQAGYVAVYYAYCKKSEYQSAENQAKNANNGIWSIPGLQQTPWEWRKKDKR